MEIIMFCGATLILCTLLAGWGYRLEVNESKSRHTGTHGVRAKEVPEPFEVVLVSLALAVFFFYFTPKIVSHQVMMDSGEWLPWFGVLAAAALTLLVYFYPQWYLYVRWVVITRTLGACRFAAAELQLSVGLARRIIAWAVIPLLVVPRRKYDFAVGKLYFHYAVCLRQIEKHLQHAVSVFPWHKPAPVLVAAAWPQKPVSYRVKKKRPSSSRRPRKARNLVVP